MNKYIVAKDSLIFFMIGSLLLIIGLIILNVSNEQMTIKTRHQYETQQMCDMARLANNFKTCYSLEKQYNVEYVCAPSGLQCAVEVR